MCKCDDIANYSSVCFAELVWLRLCSITQQLPGRPTGQQEKVSCRAEVAVSIDWRSFWWVKAKSFRIAGHHTPR